MPKKGTKKIYSMRRRAIKTMKQLEKQKRQAEQAKREQQCQQARAFTRGEKEFQRTSNANNTTHTVPFANRPVVNEEVFSIPIVEKNTANNASWNSYPSNLQVLGLPRKGKFQQTKRLSNKQKQQLARRQTQKERSKAIQQARELKSAERTLNNAALANGTFNNTNAQSITTEEWYNELARQAAEEEAEFERLEREYEENQIKEARKKMKAAPKNTMIVRKNDEKVMTIGDFVKYIKVMKPNKFEILYLDEQAGKSYYYIFKYKQDANSNNYNSNIYNNYHRMMGYRLRGYDPVYEVYSKAPYNYFRPVYVPHSYNFYGPNENNNSNTYDARFIDTVYVQNITKYIHRLPKVNEMIRKEEEAKARKEAARATAPYKLKELQLKGLEGWIQEMEQKTGKTMPRNVQNIVERSIRPFDYRYYQGRDNLQRIKTDLFQ